MAAPRTRKDPRSMLFERANTMGEYEAIANEQSSVSMPNAMEPRSTQASQPARGVKRVFGDVPMVNVNISIPKELRQRINMIAAKSGVSSREVYGTAILEYAERAEAADNVADGAVGSPAGLEQGIKPSDVRGTKGTVQPDEPLTEVVEDGY